MSYRQNPVKQKRHRSRKQQHLSLKYQQGVVLVIALFIVALVATMAYVMMARLERDTRRTSLILRNTQAEFYAAGSVAWAMDQLRNNWEKQQPNHVIDAIPIKSPVKEMNGYTISSTIYDMQSRFNLNNLTDNAAQAAFKRLILTLDPKLSEQNAQTIVMSTVAWISPGAQNEADQYYSKLSPPYRIAHRPMQSVSELKLVKGMTAPLFNALQPYLTALPGTVLINVETASAPVLMMLSPTLTLAGARSLEQVRREKPFVSTQVFLNIDIVKNNKVPADKITVTSHYFLVETEVAIEKQHVVIYTLLERTTKERNASVAMLWQSKGVW